MNAKGRNPADRTVNLYQFLNYPLPLTYKHATSHRKVTVEPGMPEASTISFNRKLSAAGRGAHAVGLYAKRGRQKQKLPQE